MSENVCGATWTPPTALLSQPNDPRRKAKYNILSRSFFCWVDPLFWLGCRRSLEQSDLYVHPPEVDSSYLLNKFNKYWSSELKRKEDGRSPRLLLAWFKCFWWRVIVQGILLFFEVASLVSQSVVLGQLAEYFVIESPSSDDTRNAYLYAMGLGLLSFTLMYVHGMCFHHGHKLGLLTRTLMSSAIYQKILTLSQTTIGQLTVGHIVNLASNDVHKFDLAFIFYHIFWIIPLHLSAMTYLMYREIQWSAFLATLLVLAQVPVQIILVRIFTKLRFKAAQLTDKRIKVMNEVITGIRVIKMYAWEYAFKDLVASIRKNEVFIIIEAFMIRAINITYFTVSLPLIMFVVFSVYVNTSDEQITPRKVFVTLSLLTFVRLTSIHFFINGTLVISEARVAWKRIRNLLLLDELNNISNVHDVSGSDDIGLQSLSSDGNVTVQDLTASWAMDVDKPTLQNITFTINKTKPLMAVIGPVGCGKSTLLQCLLKELPALSGTVEVKGSVGYASQEAWVFSATMRENILFGLPYHPERYNTVVEACALDKDIQLLPDGDLTLVGERGVTLSGGQKARVNLARAVYHQADVYLLDDPLSAVDAAVSRHIFDRCIRELLSDKCVVLVTHQLQYLQQCDVVLGLNKGCITVYGDPSDVLKEDSGIFDFLSGDNEEDKDPRKLFAVRKQSIDSNGLEETVVSFQRTLSNIEEKDEDYEEGPDPLLMTPPLLDAISFQSVPSVSISGIHNKEDTGKEKVIQTMPVPAEERGHGRISMKTYYHYFIAGGGYVFTFILLVIFILCEGNIVMTDWWIADWAGCETECSLNCSLSSGRCSLSNDQRIGIYGGVLGSLIILGTLRAVLFFLLLLHSSRVLHNNMFGRVLRAPILFFDTNPIGRVLNRFSKDIGFLDDRLPHVFYDYLMLLTRFLAIVITAVIANPYMLIVVVILFVIFISLRWYYLRTARDIKRLEALARSPVYSHISLTLQGLPTIRSYCMQNIAMNQFHTFQNQHSQSFYLYIVTVRWFGMRIDTISSLFVAAVAFTCVPLAGSLDAALVGLALTYAISLNGNFQYCIRQSAEVESLMVSAERVMAYGKLETEASLETDSALLPSAHWPDKGHIELNDLSYRHSSDGPLVLKGISCEIKSSEKIGIVGRTGAGKSSLIAALFRLAEPHGSIKIDGIEICQLGLHDLRSKISIIPQDPVLFGGSVRYNLDPFGHYDDDKIWTALEQVQLKSVVEVLEGQLDSPVSEGGSNFSVGQRQLFCLARALLRHNTILILDEATANVDLETDSIIQQVIREQFCHCTILTIAHRLDTVMDSDKIMILRGGKLIEFDEPHVLLCNSSSYLCKLVEHTGPIAAQRLKTMALNAHNERMMKDGVLCLSSPV